MIVEKYIKKGGLFEKPAFFVSSQKTLSNEHGNFQK